MNRSEHRLSHPSESALASAGRSLLGRATHLEKSFGMTRALRGASLDLYGGNIVALLGENGSGKSTLVKLLGGVLRADAGTIVVRDREMRGWPNPRVALRSGVAAVFQEILIDPFASVVENVFLGWDKMLGSQLTPGARRVRAEQLLSELATEPVPVNRSAGSLSLAAQQLICIARALAWSPEILILDEATSALDVRDRDRVFDVCRDLRAKGRAVVFITHRLEEIRLLADEVTVIRDGSTVETLTGKAIDADELLRAMTGGTGREGGADSTGRPAFGRNKKKESLPKSPSAPAVSLRGLVVRSGGQAIDLDVMRGTIVGFAGLEGHGQEECLEMIAGMRRPEEGSVYLPDLQRPVRDRHEAFRHGLLYLPRNRARDGIFPSLSVLENFTLPTLGDDVRFGLIQRRKSTKRFRAVQDELKINVPSASLPITTLSGGSQQKVILGRWLAASPRVLLLDDPSRGVDIGTKLELHVQLRALRDSGIAIVLISTELDELEEVADTILVFHRGSSVGEFAPQSTTREQLLGAMLGATV